jgi:hypothetical protein
VAGLPAPDGADGDHVDSFVVLHCLQLQLNVGMGVPVVAVVRATREMLDLRSFVHFAQPKPQEMLRPRLA